MFYSYSYVSKGNFENTPFQKEVYTSTFENIIVKTSTNITFEVPNLIRLTSLTGITGIIMGSVPQTSQISYFQINKGN